MQNEESDTTQDQMMTRWGPKPVSLRGSLL